jgi:hypothetical protein
VVFGNPSNPQTTVRFSTNGRFTLRLTASDGAKTATDDVSFIVAPPVDSFIDDDHSVFETDIEWMAATGITKGCNPPTNNRFCPDSVVTRAQMAAFLVRALGLTDRLDDPFIDDDDSIFEADIERLAAAGITKGCNPSEGNTKFCPDGKVTREQMAAFLVRALHYTDDGGGDLFTDDDASIFEGDIDRLGTAGVTKGCNPAEGNTKFCPTGYVTRGQMAAFLVRALNLTDDGGGDLFTDDDESIFEGDIDRMATAGITKGCNPPDNDRFCPDNKVTREVMAAFLVRALGYTDPGAGDLFTDDDASIFEGDIDRLATAGVTKGCNPPTNNRFCPTNNVTRGQMAAFLHRALG